MTSKNFEKLPRQVPKKFCYK